MNVVPEVCKGCKHECLTEFDEPCWWCIDGANREEEDQP